jgi:hypothetical protein
MALFTNKLIWTDNPEDYRGLYGTEALAIREARYWQEKFKEHPKFLDTVVVELIEKPEGH